jgi:hypothetical protein
LIIDRHPDRNYLENPGKKGATDTMQLAKDVLDIDVVVSNIDASLKFYQEILGLVSLK